MKVYCSQCGFVQEEPVACGRGNQCPLYAHDGCTTSAVEARAVIPVPDTPVMMSTDIPEATSVRISAVAAEPEAMALPTESNF